MKLAIIGGAGARTPLLVHGITGSDLPVAEVALYDPDRERLELIAQVVRRMSHAAAVTLCATSAEAIRGADYVFTSIRVGGIAARARDEAAALRHGVVGQETVGPAGFAMAMRTIGPMVEYAREVAALAPHAWIINFTNPVGIVTQAVRTQTSAKIVGICDTPTELFEETAHALGLPAAECRFDYLGLNHLGWLREVYHRGEPQLHRLWGDPAALQRVYRRPLFDPAFLAELRLLPTEYLYYYYRARDALENLRRAGQTRGQSLVRLNEQLLRDLARPGADVVRVYEDYLAVRNGSYMQAESGAAAPTAPSPWAALTGYDKIALAVVRAMHGDTGEVLPLNVSNRANLPELEGDDVVEVPCAIGAGGATPLEVGPAPAAVRELIVRVKAYERLTVEAALTGSEQARLDALAHNPLVDSPELAARLARELAP